MKINKEITFSLLTVVLAIASVHFLWTSPLVLIFTLILLAVIKGKLAPINGEMYMFFITAVIGAGGECLIMFGGPWAYADPSLVNFPIWLPFLWGLAGTTGVTLHQGLFSKENK